LNKARKCLEQKARDITSQ